QREGAATAVGEAADERRLDRLQGGTREPHRADRPRAPACRREVERSENRQRAEEERRERHRGHPAEEAAVAERTAERSEGGFLDGRGGHPQREDREQDGESGERGEDGSTAREGGDRAEHRPEHRSEDGHAERKSEHLTASVPRRRRDEPGERAGPCEATARALEEPGRPE